jgi:dTDP-4-amino-4,6-dideoxygalactose transaminase
MYWDELKDSGAGLPFRAAQGQPAYHIFPMLLPERVDRKAFIDRMREERIQTSIHYPPTHTFSYYKARFGEISLPKTEWIGAHEVTLPLYPSMGEESVQLVAAAVMKALKLQQ